MSDTEDFVRVKVNRKGQRSSGGSKIKTMVPERDVNTSKEPSSRSPRVPWTRRVPTSQTGQRSSTTSPTGNFVTTTAEMYETNNEAVDNENVFEEKDHASPVSSISTASDLVDTQSRSESMNTNSSAVKSNKKRGNWTSRVPADTPERKIVTSEDESLRSVESGDKEKSPADEYLAITINSTPSDSKVMDTEKVKVDDKVKVTAQEPEESGSKVKPKSSLLKKWTKKMAGSFTKSSTEKEEVDEEKAIGDTEGALALEAPNVMSVENETTRSKTKFKKKQRKSERKNSAQKPNETETIPMSDVVTLPPKETEKTESKPETPVAIKSLPPKKSNGKRKGLKDAKRESLPVARRDSPKVMENKSAKNVKDDSPKIVGDELLIQPAEVPPLSPSPKIAAAPPLSPSAKRNLRRREKAGEFDPNEKILGIKIHHTDLLPTDPNICHPVVRITVMTQDGNFVVKSTSQGQRQGQGHSPQKFEGKLTKNCIQQVMTRPSLLSDSGLYRLLPKWEEMVVIAEPLQKFLSPDDPLILFFEIMDFVPMGHQSLQRPSKNQADLGWVKIAWAFLKPLGVNGTRHVNRKLRLQLFRPDFSRGQSVFDWWRRKRWAKLNSTIYVTLKGILPPEPEHKSPKANLSALLNMRKNELTEALIEGQLAQSEGQRSRSQESKRNIPQWKRFPGQSCKVPNKLLKSLPASEIDSLNFRVMGNVQCVKFSPCGTLLATGLDTERYHVVLIFEIPSGKLMKNLRGHHGLIYELDWSKISDFSYTIAAASADSTVRVWKLELEEAEISVNPIAVLLHPSYVYTLEFSPTVPSFLATGCYDAVIRIWKLQNTVESTENNIVQSAPIFLLNGHRSYINSVRFHPNGQMLFSGDGRGTVCQWQLSKGKHKQPPKLEKETKLPSIGHAAITSLCLDPMGRKILVQLAQNCLKILDIETFLVLNTFQGVSNERYRLQSVLSPCGNLVLSGSEESEILIWDADTGRILSKIQISDHPTSIVSSVTYHPFDHYVAVGLLSSKEEQQPILLYTFEYPPGLSIGTISKLRTAFTGGSTTSAQRSLTFNSNEDDPEVNRSNRKTDISLKFQSILQKLDQVTGGTPQLAMVTAQVMEKMHSK